jgi:hypothetical protein
VALGQKGHNLAVKSYNIAKSTSTYEISLLYSGETSAKMDIINKIYKKIEMETSLRTEEPIYLHRFYTRIILNTNNQNFHGSCNVEKIKAFSMSSVFRGSKS